MILKWMAEGMVFIVVPLFFIFQTIEMIDAVIQMFGDLTDWNRFK